MKVTRSLDIHIVDVTIKIWAGEKTLDDFMWVPVANFIRCCHPLRGVSHLREEAIIVEVCGLPWNISKFNRINLLAEVPVVDNWWGATMRDGCRSPQLKKYVGFSLREFSIGKHKLSKFKTCVGGKR